jgi:DNA polymerase I-like protein with 3'-5' exonuclease and polymerase domains
MIHLITSRKNCYNEEELHANGMCFGKARDFMVWLDSYEGMIQLDSETNIVEGAYGWKGYLKGKNKDFVEELDENGQRIPQEKECYVVQVGDFEGENQWVFDTYELLPMHRQAIKKALSCNNQKILHNALFDYVVFKWCFDIEIDHIRDTMLMSKAVTTGLTVGKDLPKGYNGLAGCVERYLSIDLSKEEQTSFNGDPLSISQIKYAAIDVAVLGSVFNALQEEVEKWDVQNVVELECSLVRPYGDAMCENLYLDREEWKTNMDFQFSEVKRIETEFYALMIEYFKSECEDLHFLQKEDAFVFNWRSPNMKNAMLRYLYPDLPETATKISDYKNFHKYLEGLSEDGKDLGKNASPSFLNMLLNKNYEDLERNFVRHHMEFLTEIDVFIPKGKVLINLKSSDQKLSLFRLIKPDLANTDKESIGKILHPLATKLKEYNKSSKLSTSYGQNFLDAINPDGMFRIKNFSQILNTGRSSMSMMQLLPGTKTYRNPFRPNNPKTGTRDDGYVWKVAGADYAGQELCVLATFAQEPAMIEALENGYDLHSINTARLFPDKWKALGGEEKPKGKPEDKVLQGLRNNTKATIFGICYGKSAIGLGESLGIPGTTADMISIYKEEYDRYMNDNYEDYKAFYPSFKSGRNSDLARHEWIKGQHKIGKFLPDVVTGDDMIDRVFTALPFMAKFLNESAQEGYQNKYIRTPDIIGRVRRFAFPEFKSDESAIRRASQNFPIQSSSANMTKYAICLIKRYIEEHDLSNKMKFCLPLHDEIRYIVREDFAEEGLKIIIDKMEEAGEFILGNKLQKAEGEITDVWEK